MIKWTEDLNTGIDVIDNQHIRIVDYINEIGVHLRNNHIDGIEDVLKNLIDYTVTHFEFEEEVLAESGYPLLSSHKKVHAAFKKHIDEYSVRFVNADTSERRRIAKNILSELTIWLTNHIKRDDNDYVELVKSHIEPRKSGLMAKVKKFFS